MDLQRLSYYCYFFDWCFFFFSLSPPFPQLNADSMWCSLPGKKRTLKELKTKQNYNLNLTFTSSCFFFFFLLSWCINKRRAIGILKKKKTNDLSETRMHDTNKQTLLQQLDISVAYMCDFLHCVAKGFPQKVIIGVFFFSFVSRLDHRHQGSQVGLSAGVLHAAATITNEQITNSQTNDKKKKNKQTKNTHPHANNRMLPSLFFFPFFQNENKIGRSVWSVEDSNMKNKQRKRTLKQRKCWSAGGKATIKKSVRFLEKGEKCLPSFFKLFFSHPWAAFGRIGDKHGKLGFRAQDSVGSHFNFFFFGMWGKGLYGWTFLS